MYFLVFLFAALVSTIPIDAFSPATISTSSQFQRHAKPTNKSNRRNSIGSTGNIHMGFGSKNNNNQPPKRATFTDPSYGQTLEEQTWQEAQTAMHHFFTTHNEWYPLFRHVMSLSDCAAAQPFLTHEYDAEDVWGGATGNDDSPWSILPDKPTSESSLSTLSLFLDEWQESLMDIPMDAFKDVRGGYDLHFLEEGRRTIAVTRFHVLQHPLEGEEWEDQLFRICWSELGHLMSKDDGDTGSLVLLPQDLWRGDGRGSLEYVKEFVEKELIRPIEWLGRSGDWEIVAMERGIVGVRLLYKLGAIPDLSEKYQGEA